jgi:hypothetical protein
MFLDDPFRVLANAVRRIMGDSNPQIVLITMETDSIDWNWADAGHLDRCVADRGNLGHGLGKIILRAAKVTDCVELCANDHEKPSFC